MHIKLQLLLPLFLLFASCDAVTTTIDVEEETEEETYFSVGEYGGSSLPDKEDIYNFTFSNDGKRVAFIRRRTPGDLTEPIRQLWIADKDGRNPEFITSGMGTVDWSDDDSQLAVTYILGPGYNFIYLLDLEKREATQLTGSEHHDLYSYSTTNPQYIPEEKALFVTVWTKPYQQNYERGMYVLNYENDHTEGPFGDIYGNGQLGNNGEFFTAQNYNVDPNDAQRYFLIYNLENNLTKDILPDLPGSDFRLDYATPNPRGTEIVLTIRRDYADQLVLTSSGLDEFEQITEFGGHNPIWMPDGNFLFLRDINKGPGAHNVPHVYDMATGEISKLWEDLPEFVPEFPPVSNFNPIPIFVDW